MCLTISNLPPFVRVHVFVSLLFLVRFHVEFVIVSLVLLSLFVQPPNVLFLSDRLPRALFVDVPQFLCVEFLR